ncbi:MAG: type II toxin-antitoxin system Phd/YefM family antitoxin [Planctomycetota bacterium]
MKAVTFSQFRQNASSLITDVEKGEIVRILRHGKPVAEVIPVAEESSDTLSWKRHGLRLSVKGRGLSSAIRDERRRS